MLEQVKAEWDALKGGAPGVRFVAAYERHRTRNVPYLKPALFFAAVFLLVFGMVLAVDSAAVALACFVMSTLLFASESYDVARVFDVIESRLRGGRGVYRLHRSRRTTRVVQHAQIDQRAVDAALRAVEQRMRATAPDPDRDRPVVHARARLTPQPLTTPPPQRQPQRRVASTMKMWSIDR